MSVLGIDIHHSRASSAVGAGVPACGGENELRAAQGILTSVGISVAVYAAIAFVVCVFLI